MNKKLKSIITAIKIKPAEKQILVLPRLCCRDRQTRKENMMSILSSGVTPETMGFEVLLTTDSVFRSCIQFLLLPFHLFSAGSSNHEIIKLVGRT